jgi:hypothetical protein
LRARCDRGIEVRRSVEVRQRTQFREGQAQPDAALTRYAKHGVAAPGDPREQGVLRLIHADQHVAAVERRLEYDVGAVEPRTRLHEVVRALRWTIGADDDRTPIGVTGMNRGSQHPLSQVAVRLATQFGTAAACKFAVCWSTGPVAIAQFTTVSRARCSVSSIRWACSAASGRPQARNQRVFAWSNWRPREHRDLACRHQRASR